MKTKKWPPFGSCGYNQQLRQQTKTTNTTQRYLKLRRDTQRVRIWDLVNFGHDHEYGSKKQVKWILRATSDVFKKCVWGVFIRLVWDLPSHLLCNILKSLLIGKTRVIKLRQQHLKWKIQHQTLKTWSVINHKWYYWHHSSAT